MTASIPREDVAAFMLSEIEAPQFSARTPIIAADYLSWLCAVETSGRSSTCRSGAFRG
jgi:hypothetical protein